MTIVSTEQSNSLDNYYLVNVSRQSDLICPCVAEQMHHIVIICLRYDFVIGYNL